MTPLGNAQVPPHMKPGDNVYPFGPVADVPGRPFIATRTMAEATRDKGMLEACDLYDSFAETLQIEPPSTFEKIESALGSRSFLIFYSGVYSGALFTAIMAYAWSGL